MMGTYFYESGFWISHWLWMLPFAAVLVIPAWRLCQRVGYPGWLGLLIVVPMANLILLYVLAFGEWPAEKNGNDRPGPD